MLVQSFIETGPRFRVYRCLTLFGEAIMDTMSWNYWLPDGKHQALTPELLATLESVIATSPNHPGANHHYIHAVEASDNPKRAERYADKLAKLAPGAGHLVHMPSHLYIRVGRYQDAVDVNWAALAADAANGAACLQGYLPEHNADMLVWAASMAGNLSAVVASAGDSVRPGCAGLID